MFWKIGKFEFCDQTFALVCEQHTQQLEPIVGQLLSYFCQHPNTVISRDQLIKHVWQARFITDNAVSRVVTKLRKALKDDPRQPKFIVTLPKRGYQFILNVENHTELQPPTADITEQTTQKTANPQNRPASRRQTQLLAFIIGISVIIITSLWFLSKPHHSSAKLSSPSITQAKVLTRNPGTEFQAQISADGKFLMFNERLNNHIHLRIQRLTDKQQVSVEHEPEAWVGPGSWNSDGSQIAYLKTTQDSCQYFIREVSDLQLGKPELIHNCPPGSYGKILFTHDDDLLVYSESKTRGAPFELFSIRLSTGNKQRLTQPPLVLGGNSQYDLHPHDNTLLLSSPDSQQWEGFYRLDLATDELTLLFKQDAYTCCGIWDHSGNRVVLIGEHPAYEILSYDLNGKAPRIIYQSTQRLSPPHRHSNGKDYLFTASQNNRDLLLLDDEGEKQVIAASSVDERNGRFSNDGNKIAYISLASGSEEIWQYDTVSGKTRQITQSTSPRHYLDLIWDPTGTRIAALTMNEILIVEVDTGNSELVRIPQQEIRAVSFKNSTTLGFSIQQGSQWQVFDYNLEQRSLRPANIKWQYIRYGRDQEDTLYQNQQGQYFFGQQQTPIAHQVFETLPFLQRRQFNLLKQGDTFYYQDYQSGKYELFKLKLTDVKAQPVSSNESRHFDINRDNKLISVLTSGSADLYQTVYQ